jgi:hypothetical protein
VTPLLRRHVRPTCLKDVSIGHEAHWPARVPGLPEAAHGILAPGRFESLRIAIPSWGTRGEADSRGRSISPGRLGRQNQRPRPYQPPPATSSTTMTMIRRVVVSMQRLRCLRLHRRHGRSFTGPLQGLVWAIGLAATRPAPTAAPRSTWLSTAPCRLPGSSRASAPLLPLSSSGSGSLYAVQEQSDFLAQPF